MDTNQFDRFQFQPFVIKALTELGFQKPTEIQERLIPTIMRGENAIGQSQTGTGKTHAYLLPLINNIGPEENEVKVVITAPTRELASQIYHEVLKLTKHLQDGKITAKLFVGGTDKQRAIDKLRNQPQVVVGTPGRINDLIKEKALLVHNATSIVVDEADLMLDMGFIEDVDQIAAKMPENLQILVFSATIPEKLKPFLRKYMDNPRYTHVSPEQATAAKVEHVLVPLRHRKKIQVLKDMLVSYNPYLAIVFTNTKQMADSVADQLLEKGLRVGRIHGGLTPRERKKVMKQIADLEYQYVIATDLASRGIDIQGISHVINYELPSDLDFYIHRVGRTARAGFSGIAATIFETSDEDALNRLEKMGISFKYVDIEGDKWTDIGERNKRKNRRKQVDEVDQLAKSIVRKPKKVKPGYKKKMTAEMDSIKKRQRRITKKKK